MIFIVKIKPEPSGQYGAVWFADDGDNHFANGTAISGASDPIAALRMLASEVERVDAHQAMLNAIDSQGDPC